MKWAKEKKCIVYERKKKAQNNKRKWKIQTRFVVKIKYIFFSFLKCHILFSLNCSKEPALLPEGFPNTNLFLLSMGFIKTYHSFQ